MSASKFKKKNIRFFSNFEFVMSQVHQCYLLMLDDFTSIPNNEVEIHKRLYKDYLENDNILSKLGLKEYFFDYEVPQINENYKIKGRTDIKVYHNKDRENERNAFYIIELKRLDGGKHLNKEYIKEGIQRFTLGKYPSFLSLFGMIGFVVKEIDIDKNVKKINTLLETDYSKPETVKYLQNDNFTNCSYQSEHKDSRDNNLKAFHQFWDFNEKINLNK